MSYEKLSFENLEINENAFESDVPPLNSNLGLPGALKLNKISKIKQTGFSFFHPFK